MHPHRRHVVLTCQHKSQSAVLHQGELFAIRGVNGVECLYPFHLGLYLVGQIGDGHGAHIDDVVGRLLPEIEFVVHLANLSLARRDLDRLHDLLGLGPRQIDMQQPVFHRRAVHLDPVGQNEAALELAGRDAAMQVDPLGVVLLATANHQLVVLDLDLEVLEDALAGVVVPGVRAEGDAAVVTLKAGG